MTTKRACGDVTIRRFGRAEPSRICLQVLARQKGAEEELGGANVRCLEPFLTLLDFELDCLALFE